MKAKTVAQVVAAEAGGKTAKDRFKAMQTVFSSIFNRAQQTGVPFKDIVSVKSQFSAYNSPMPAGTASLVGMAQRAIDSIIANGPTHKGTYYATPDRVGSLPKGLKAEATSVDGMKVFSDPQNRAIKTAAGVKAPTANASYKTDNLPSKTNVTPTGRPMRSREMFDNIAAGRNIQVSKPFSPETYAKAEAPREVDPGPLTRGLSTFDVARAITPAAAQARVAQERARVAAETQANKSVFTKAGEQVAGVKDSLVGFFDSLTGANTAVAAAPHPNAPTNFSTPKTDRLAKAPAATYADVMAGKPVKTTSIVGIPEAKPEAIYDDPRALAYAQKMTPEPVNSLNVPAIDPEIAAKVTPDQPVTVDEEVAPEVRQRVRTVQRTRRTPVQITVNRPNSVAPSLPGGTLGGIKASERYSVGTGLQGITAALGGVRGATGFSRSNLGMSVTNRGAHLGTITHNEKYGTDTFRDPNGNVTGTHFSQPGGFLGALGRSFGIGGASSSGGKAGGKSSGSSNGGSSGGKSGGAKGAAGGGLGQSQHSL